MRQGDYVYATTDRANPPKRMRLLRKVRETSAGPQWEAELEVDGVKTPTLIAEQALAPWSPPSPFVAGVRAQPRTPDRVFRTTPEQLGRRDRCARP